MFALHQAGVVIKNEFDSDQRITFTANEALSECSMAEIATNGKCAGRAGSTNRDCNQISGNVLDKKKCEINFSTTLFEGMHAVAKHRISQTWHDTILNVKKAWSKASVF